MTREKAIERWTEIAETVFTAENRIANEWNRRVMAAVILPPDQQAQFVKEYCRAIAEEITSHTSDEDFALMDDEDDAPDEDILFR